MGGDNSFFILKNRYRISIHAPVWEATPLVRFLIPMNIFQSTPPCGRRPLPFINSTKHFIFQSTPPCGRRLQQARFLTVILFNFNPRPRVGGDYPFSNSLHIQCRFQSTPPCGRRHNRLCAS